MTEVVANLTKLRLGACSSTQGPTQVAGTHGGTQSSAQMGRWYCTLWLNSLNYNTGPSEIFFKILSIVFISREWRHFRRNESCWMIQNVIKDLGKSINHLSSLIRKYSFPKEVKNALMKCAENKIKQHISLTSLNSPTTTLP